MNELTEIIVVNSVKAVDTLKYYFDQLPEDEKAKRSGHCYVAGRIVVFEHESFPQLVMEEIHAIEPNGEPSVIRAAYLKNQYMNSLGALVTTRRKLIRALAEDVGLSPENIGIEDFDRMREIGPEEATTGQLIDLLAERQGLALQSSVDKSVSLDG